MKRHEAEGITEAIADSAYEILNMARCGAERDRMVKLAARVIADIYDVRPSDVRSAIEDELFE